MQFSVDAPLKMIASNHGCRFLFYDWYKASFWGLEMDNYGRFTLASCVNIFNSRGIVRKASSGTSAEVLYISMVSLAATYLISDARSAPSLYSSGNPALKNPLTPHPHKQKAPPAGFEPATSRVEAGCSNPLSYGGMEGFLPSGNFTASIHTYTTRPYTIPHNPPTPPVHLRVCPTY